MDSHLTITSDKTGLSYTLSTNQCEEIAAHFSALLGSPSRLDARGLSVDGTRDLSAFLRREL